MLNISINSFLSELPFEKSSNPPKKRAGKSDSFFEGFYISRIIFSLS